MMLQRFGEISSELWMMECNLNNNDMLLGCVGDEINNNDDVNKI